MEYKIMDISPRDLYAIVCALRGPDMDNLYEIKYMFTARIRAIFFSHILGVSTVECPGMVRTWGSIHVGKFFREVKYIRRNKRYHGIFDHYMSHVILALNVLKELGGLGLGIMKEMKALHELAVLIYDYVYGVFSFKKFKRKFYEIMDKMGVV